MFENSKTLWDDALAKNPDCWIGYNSLGIWYFQAGDVNASVANLQKGD